MTQPMRTNVRSDVKITTCTKSMIKFGIRFGNINLTKEKLKVRSKSRSYTDVNLTSIS